MQSIRSSSIPDTVNSPAYFNFPKSTRLGALFCNFIHLSADATCAEIRIALLSKSTRLGSLFCNFYYTRRQPIKQNYSANKINQARFVDQAILLIKPFEVQLVSACSHPQKKTTRIITDGMQLPLFSDSPIYRLFNQLI